MEFIQRHIKLVAALAGSIILLLIIILLVISLRSSGTVANISNSNTNTAATVPEIGNGTGYNPDSQSGSTPQDGTGTGVDENGNLTFPFMKSNSSDEEKYLMLTADILAEEYGTYSAADYSGLVDVGNKSTAKFQATVQTLIDYVSGPGYDKTASVKTSIDPNSIKLISKTDQEAVVTMDVDYTNESGTHLPSVVKVSFVYIGNSWLVDNITLTQK